MYVTSYIVCLIFINYLQTIVACSCNKAMFQRWNFGWRTSAPYGRNWFSFGRRKRKSSFVFHVEIYRGEFTEF